ncbi:Oidioi.mRNA.OKI2018_I69.XSR.g16261.t1.cds [Oikopleura dioica]|uniref:Oidioi.mRNA.OKI2018_I69.PAR.g10450.t1.cds n=1 Tax=Oikopleura dioica TaxID=34765 RepID=A0ABN7RU85_OIKDI|nr:Oidioi.mRNA.OKI2018_I69.PAR.g10450.t1.cds [Oikopleura dioica]CAG5084823.1 Oidioi.mRNA.OKI2018_I69.PAR.g10745.t1.cds [Oikopleura dioica]CAG5099111.1 Oidioi.mRNA.OKI2018_I69.XSR.g16261.t1.cds [Oikopleura dioica]
MKKYYLNFSEMESSDSEVEEVEQTNTGLEFLLRNARSHPLPQLRPFLEEIYHFSEREPWILKFKGFFLVKSDSGIFQLVKFPLGPRHCWTLETTIGSDHLTDLDNRLCARIAEQENKVLVVVDSAVLMVNSVPRRRSRLENDGYELALSIENGLAVFYSVGTYSLVV